MPYDFLRLKFAHFTSTFRLLFVEKREPIIFGFKNGIQRGKNARAVKVFW